LFFSNTYNDVKPNGNVAIATLLAWHRSLIVLAMALLYLEVTSKRLPNTMFLLFVAASFLMSCDSLVNQRRTNNETTSTGISPLVTKLNVVMVVGSNLWADITHNPDDYGLNDDVYLVPMVTLLRQRLLHDDHENDENEHTPGREGGRDNIEQGDDGPSELNCFKNNVHVRHQCVESIVR
jgi:hypothetical protein